MWINLQFTHTMILYYQFTFKTWQRRESEKHFQIWMPCFFYKNFLLQGHTLCLELHAVLAWGMILGQCTPPENRDLYISPHSHLSLQHPFFFFSFKASCVYLKVKWCCYYFKYPITCNGNEKNTVCLLANWLIGWCWMKWTHIQPIC